MSKKQIEVLERDDEVLREQGMTGGDTKCGRWTLRVTAATEVSWMQYNSIIADDNGLDIIWRASAFSFIHSAPKSEVRECVRNRELFVERVDDWISANNPKGWEIKTLVSALNDRMSEWYSSSSELSATGPSSGN